jgi:hypothetical protein
MASPGKFERKQNRETGDIVMLWERKNRSPRKVMVVKDGNGYRTIYQRDNGKNVSTRVRGDNFYNNKKDARKEAVAYMRSVT